ncbi:unnamed protein product [Protopolystoma xenopodis]|uniref:Uncharacterized protein n=1 Tax=Protopolystoma xenopodis TaxID=117903 RepID=A0A3S5A4P7_9PLAT|nr:unnamed protein product [Protopolystoma xenopodis]
MPGSHVLIRRGVSLACFIGPSYANKLALYHVYCVLRRFHTASVDSRSSLKGHSATDICLTDLCRHRTRKPGGCKFTFIAELTVAEPILLARRGRNCPRKAVHFVASIGRHNNDILLACAKKEQHDRETIMSKNLIIPNR